jgi:hypothetical protein
MAGGSQVGLRGRSDLHLPATHLDPGEVVPLKEIDVSLNSTPGNRTNRRRIVMAAAAAVAVIGMTGVAFAITNASDDEPPSPAATPAPPDSQATTVPTTMPSTSTTAEAPSVTPADDNGALEGRWTAQALTLEQIRAGMLQAGVTDAEVDDLFVESGMKTDYTFSLEFHDNDFTLFAMTPAVRDVAREVPEQQAKHPLETGMFVYTPDHLSLTFPDLPSLVGHTLEFRATTSCCDGLKLDFIDSTLQGTPDEFGCAGTCTAATAASYARARDVEAIAYYAIANFLRRP